jgi:uncharacterized protein with PIN domain
MLGGLARWLRAAGHDVATAEPGTDDRTLLALAADRVLLTRDRKLASHGAVIVEAATLDALAAELRARIRLDWLEAPLTRCLVDNSPLEPARPEDLARVPPQSRAAAGKVTRCPRCERVYWAGGHVRRIEARLRRWAA